MVFGVGFLKKAWIYEGDGTRYIGGFGEMSGSVELAMADRRIHHSCNVVFTGKRK